MTHYSYESYRDFDLFNSSKAWLVYNNRYTKATDEPIIPTIFERTKATCSVLLMVRQVEILFAIIPVPNYHYYPVLHIKLSSSLISMTSHHFLCQVTQLWPHENKNMSLCQAQQSTHSR